MKGDSEKIKKLFNDERERFIIPLYQRNYDWSKENCKRLFDDMLLVHKNRQASHFFGSIVVCRMNKVDDDWIVIDGQQRITTVSLFILALTNLASRKEIESGNRDIKSTRNAYLFVGDEEIKTIAKLVPVNRDGRAYNALLFSSPEEYDKDSNMTHNYNYFCKRIKECNLSFGDLVDALNKFEVIFIRLEDDEDPQLVFESLNSTGLDLSEADKIRNYLLMSLNVEEQKRCYEQYWNKIEECTEYNPTPFIRYYLTIRLKRISVLEKLYAEFKEYFTKEEHTRQEVLADMLRFARYYDQIKNGKTHSEFLNKKLKQFAIINSWVGMPFLLSFFAYSEDQHLNEEEIYNVLDIVENYWARRIICNLPSNALTKVFSTLHLDVLGLMKANQKQEDASQVVYSNVLKYVLLRKEGTSEFPQDEILKEEFKRRNIYKLQKEYLYFLFERLENENSKEGFHDIVKEMSGENPITIEHIMPQTLTDEWEKALGEDYENIHATYLHTFANLTLTGYNQKYSNKPFIEKRDCKDGFKESRYSLNDYVKKCEKWTLEELLKRQELLLNRFLRLWPMLETTFQPLEKETDKTSLDDEEFVLTKRKIKAYIYDGTNYTCSSWKDMLVEVLQLLYKDNEDEIQSLCRKNSHNFSIGVPHGDLIIIANDCLVYTSLATRDIIKTLRYAFDYCHVPQSSLEFILKPKEKRDW